MGTTAPWPRIRTNAPDSPSPSMIDPPYPDPSAGGDAPRTAPPGLTSLDTLETPVSGIVYSPPATPDDIPTDAALIFRHGFWRARRAATAAALIEAKTPYSRQSRFELCGSRAWVLKTVTAPTQYRIACDHCRDRFCEACQVERRRTVCMNLRAQLPAVQLRFVTLTLKSRSAPLTDQIDQIWAYFKQLRKTEVWKSNVTGGLSFFEITRNETTQMFHPHVHVLVEGKYLPQKVLRTEWLKITGDSYIVDVKFVRDPIAAAGYVAKYAGKAIAANVWQNRSSLVEVITALAGRRTFNAFGSWRKLSLSRVASDDLEWTPIAPLHRLITLAASGDVAARQIMAQIRGVNLDEAILLGLPPPK